MSQNRNRIAGFTLGSSGLFGVQDQSIASGSSNTKPLTDGGIDPAFVSRIRANPSISMTTLAIGAALTAMGIGGARGQATVWSLLQGDVGEIASGNVHQRIRLDNSHVIPMELSGADGSDVTLSYMAMGFAAGGGDALSAEGGIAAPSITINRDRYRIAGVYLNGISVPGATAQNVSFGIDLQAVYADGNIGPTDTFINGRMPMMTATFNRSVRQTFMGGSTGPRVGPRCIESSNAVDFYYKKVNCEGVAVAGQYLKISAVAGLVEVQTSAGNPISDTVIVDVAKSNSSPILALDLSANLPGG